MKKSIFIFTCLFLASYCFADTFTHSKTGEIFYGYATQKKRGTETLVCIKNKKEPRYLNLADYNIEWNYLGRKNEVVSLPIKTVIDLRCETEAFEKVIETASNHGPLFILIEIDTPGGRADLMEQICAAITKTNNCHTIAFVSGAKYGGAYSAGAIIALACDYIYMAEGTAIGAATPILSSSESIKDLKSVYGETVGEKMMSASRAYIATIAEKNGRPGLLAKAMVDKDIEVLEVIRNGETVFIEPESKKVNESVVKVWSKKGSLLTLTVTEAVQCGMADKTVGSLKGLISDLGSANVKIKRDNEIAKARRKFERSKQQLDRIYDEIDLHVKKINPLLEHANFLTKEYNRLNNSYASNREKLMKSADAERKYTLSVLSDVLKRLISKYKVAIVLSQSHPDLEVDVAALEKEINSGEVQLKEIKLVY